MKFYNTRASFVELLSSGGFQVVGYLNHLPRFQIIYFYIYLLLRTINAVLNLFSVQKQSIYSRRIPFTGKRFYNLIMPLFLKVAKIDDDLNLCRLNTSTFVVAQKNTCVG
jgi:hypothetical protein